MKNVILFSLLLFSGVAMSQNKSAISFRQALYELPVSLGYKKFDNLPTSLTVYNTTTMLTDQYISTNNGYLRSSATDLPVTLRGITGDSFNPNSAVNMQTALGMGAVRTLFKL